MTNPSPGANAAKHLEKFRQFLAHLDRVIASQKTKGHVDAR